MIRTSSLHKHVEIGTSILKGIFELNPSRIQAIKDSFSINTNELSGVVFTQGQRSYLFSNMSGIFLPYDQFKRNVPITRDYEVTSEVFEKAIISASNTEKGIQITLTQESVLPIQIEMTGQTENIFPTLLESAISALCLPKDLLARVGQSQQIALVMTQRNGDYDASLVYKLSLDKTKPDEPVVKMELVNNVQNQSYPIEKIKAEKNNVINGSEVVYIISPSQ